MVYYQIKIFSTLTARDVKEEAMKVQINEQKKLTQDTLDIKN